MTTKYRVETWDPVTNMYHIWWIGNSLEQAETMFHKPYVQHLTRKLIKTIEEELYRERGKK